MSGSTPLSPPSSSALSTRSLFALFEKASARPLKPFLFPQPIWQVLPGSDQRRRSASAVSSCSISAESEPMRSWRRSTSSTCFRARWSSERISFVRHCLATSSLLLGCPAIRGMSSLSFVCYFVTNNYNTLVLTKRHKSVSMPLPHCISSRLWLFLLKRPMPPAIIGGGHLEASILSW